MTSLISLAVNIFLIFLSTLGTAAALNLNESAKRRSDIAASAAS